MKRPLNWHELFQFVATDAGLCYSTINSHTNDFSTVIDSMRIFNESIVDNGDGVLVEFQWDLCTSTSECSIVIVAKEAPGENFTIVSSFPNERKKCFFVIYDSIVLICQYIHPPNNMIDMRTTLKVNKSPFIAGKFTLTILIDEIVSSDRIKLFGVERRRCRFGSETTDNNLFGQHLYTENSCILDCRVKIAMDICDCRPFFYQIGGNFQTNNSEP